MTDPCIHFHEHNRATKISVLSFYNMKCIWLTVTLREGEDANTTRATVTSGGQKEETLTLIKPLLCRWGAAALCGKVSLLFCKHWVFGHVSHLHATITLTLGTKTKSCFSAYNFTFSEMVSRHLLKIPRKYKRPLVTATGWLTPSKPVLSVPLRPTSSSRPTILHPQHQKWKTFSGWCWNRGGTLPERNNRIWESFADTKQLLWIVLVKSLRFALCLWPS